MVSQPYAFRPIAFRPIAFRLYDRCRFAERAMLAGEAACRAMVGRPRRAIRIGERDFFEQRLGPPVDRSIHCRARPTSVCVFAVLQSDGVAKSRLRKYCQSVLAKSISSSAKKDMIDRGHGSALICAFVDDLLQAGAPKVLTDPSPANTRAIRACEKAGFRQERPVSTPDGDALLMVRDPNGT